MARRKSQTIKDSWQPNHTTPLSKHRLSGLEPDNLLAHLALLGLLRALETSRPNWHPRAFWSVKTHPWRPILTLAEAKTELDVADAAAEGVKSLLRPVEDICEKAAEAEQTNAKQAIPEIEKKIEENRHKGKGVEGLKSKLKKLRKAAAKRRKVDKVVEIAETMDDLRNLNPLNDLAHERWISCLSAPALDQNGEWSAAVSPLKLTSGQQAFAGLLVSFAKECDFNEIARALFKPWRRLHRGHSFRFDDAEARRYAYLAFDPSDKSKWSVPGQTGTAVAPSERGANVLASASFQSFPIFSLKHGVAIPGMCPQDGGRLRLPIWSAEGGRGATRAGIEALIRLAHKMDEMPQANLTGWHIFRIIKLDETNPKSDYKVIASDGFISSGDHNRK